MKRAGVLFASAVAASSAAFTSSDDRQIRVLKPSDEVASTGNGSTPSQRNLDTDKFKPSLVLWCEVRGEPWFIKKEKTSEWKQPEILRDSPNLIL